MLLFADPSGLLLLWTGHLYRTLSSQPPDQILQPGDLVRLAYRVQHTLRAASRKTEEAWTGAFATPPQKQTPALKMDSEKSKTTEPKAGKTAQTVEKGHVQADAKNPSKKQDDAQVQKAAREAMERSKDYRNGWLMLS